MGFLSQYAFKKKRKRFLAALFDFCGGIVFFPLRLRQKPGPSQIKRILLIRLDHLGDLAMTRPAIAALRERFPHVQMDLLISREYAPLMADSREIRDILLMEHSWFSKSSLMDQWREARTLAARLKNRGYDLAVDFRGDIRNILLMAAAGIPERLGYGITGGNFLLTRSARYSRDLHQVLLNFKLLEPLGIQNRTQSYPFIYSGTRKLNFREGTGRLLPSSSRPRVIIHTGAGYPSKQWPAAKFQELIQTMLSENAGSLILIGTEAEKNFLTVEPGPQLIDLRGRTRLEELPVLFDSCHLYIGHDSGPSHIAAAQGLPLIILFSGTNRAEVWHPWTESLELVRHEVSCSPCEARECPLKHHDCMEKISTAEVLEKIRAVLHKSQSGKS